MSLQRDGDDDDEEDEDEATPSAGAHPVGRVHLRHGSRMAVAAEEIPIRRCSINMAMT